MGDGAEWIWNLADQHFPGAVQIVDLYHARQHLSDLARRLHPNDQVKAERLDEGPPKTTTRSGQNRKAGCCDSLHRFHQS
jgi:transposase